MYTLLFSLIPELIKLDLYKFPPKLAGYSLVEEDIVLRTRSQRSPDAVHVSLEDDHRYRAILNLISIDSHMYNCIDKKSMMRF